MMHFDFGQVFVYGGGTGVSCFSAVFTANALADPEKTSLLEMPIVYELTLGDVTALAGLLMVFLRLMLDIFKHVSEKKNRDR